MEDNLKWEDENTWEGAWWESCQNTYGEETKQLTYARLMRLEVSISPKGSPCIDAQRKTILDIGGGPVSMLLKCFNLKQGTIIDPCFYPHWVYSRYDAARIKMVLRKAEHLLHWIKQGHLSSCYDEVWIYNCLQHVEDPIAILQAAKRVAPVLRIFEWAYCPVSPGHPHLLTKELFDRALAPGGLVSSIGESWAPSPSYSGVFSWDDWKPL